MSTPNATRPAPPLARSTPSWLRADAPPTDAPPARLPRAASDWLPRDYVFLLGHMRSYSTVLSHVLGSSPEIAGYTEAHLKYHRRSDLLRLRARVARALGRWPTGRYLLDKQLHNSMHLPRQWRELPGFRALIFVRAAAPTLGSLRALAGAEKAQPWYLDWDACARYYCERVLALAAHGVTLGERALVFPAEAIVERPDALFRRIEAHLGLRQPLSAEYHARRLTGRAKHGDPSERIRAGRILTGRPDGAPAEPASPPPAALVARCEEVRAHALAQLHRWCPGL